MERKRYKIMNILFTTILILTGLEIAIIALAIIILLFMAFDFYAFIKKRFPNFFVSLDVMFKDAKFLTNLSLAFFAGNLVAAFAVSNFALISLYILLAFLSFIVMVINYGKGLKSN